jgi:hypothetical protein
VRCGDCKHWHQAVIEEDEDASDWKTVLTDLGFCQAVEGEPINAAVRSRDNEALLRKRDIEEIGDRKAAPCDGSGYAAALLTRDNFGCVLFEQKAGGSPAGGNEP